jgi:hypothetical protein
MPRRTGRPPLEREDKDKLVPIATRVRGEIFNKLLAEIGHRGANIGAVVGYHLNRDFDFEEVWGRAAFERTHLIGRVLLNAIVLSEETNDPIIYEKAIVDIWRRLWTAYPNRSPEADKRVRAAIEDVFNRIEAHDQIAAEERRP